MFNYIVDCFFLCFRTKPMAAPVLQPLLLVETKTDSRCSITVADGNKDMAWSHYFNNQDRRTWNFRLNQAYLSGQLDLHRAEGFSSSNTTWLTNFVCKYNVEYGLNCKMRKAECNSQLCIWTLIIGITETNWIIYSVYITRLHLLVCLAGQLRVGGVQQCHWNCKWMNTTIALS